jgi:hypothetical protein
MNQDERTKALRAAGMVAYLRWEGNCPEDKIATKAGFESVEHMRWQLARWGLPDWIRFNFQVDVSETAHQEEAPLTEGTQLWATRKGSLGRCRNPAL